MSCPLLITASVPALKAGTTMYKIMNTLLSVAGLGLALQIIGDTHKSFGKSRGENLITTGTILLAVVHYTYLLMCFS